MQRRFELSFCAMGSTPMVSDIDKIRQESIRLVFSSALALPGSNHHQLGSFSLDANAILSSLNGSDRMKASELEA